MSMLLKLSPLILLVVITGCTSFPIPSGSKHIHSGKSEAYEKVISRKRIGYALKCDYRSSTQKLQITLCEKSQIEFDRINEKTSINEYYYTLIGFFPLRTSSFWGKPSPLNKMSQFGVASCLNQTAWNIILLFTPWITTQVDEIDRKWQPYGADANQKNDNVFWTYAVILGWAKTSRTIRNSVKTKKHLSKVSKVPIGKNFSIEIIDLKTKQKKVFNARNGNIYLSYKQLPGNIYEYPKNLKINCKKYNCISKYIIKINK